MSALRLVIDTNVALDWLVFDDANARILQAAIESKRAIVCTHAILIEELRRVLAYPQLRLAAEKQQELLDRYVTSSVIAAVPPGFSRQHLCVPVGFPRCRDGDDDIFIAFAYHVEADALASKDRAVLKLEARARKFGLKIGGLSDVNAMLKASQAYSMI